MKRSLELFSGTQSFSKASAAMGYQTTTVDMLSMFSPTIKADILRWDYKVFPRDHFDVIWASPPCTEYSKAKTQGVRNLEMADALVKKTLEIIDYFNPRVWFIENVGTGLLVNRMETIRPGLKMYYVDYCAYGKPYRKRTAIWSNIPLEMKLCPGVGKCSQMSGRKHNGSCGNGYSTYNQAKISSVWQKNSMPEALMTYILSQV